MKKDFFISYNKADREIAVWIAQQLEGAGYSTIIQAADMPPGSNFVLEMHQAATAAARTIAVLSPDFLHSHFTQPEWPAAFQQAQGQLEELLFAKPSPLGSNPTKPNLKRSNNTSTNSYAQAASPSSSTGWMKSATRAFSANCNRLFQLIAKLLYDMDALAVISIALNYGKTMSSLTSNLRRNNE